MDFDAGRGLIGFFILLFLLVAYNRLANPEFLDKLGLTGNMSKEEIKFYITFFQPLMLAGILGITVAIIFPGTGVPEAAMLGLIGIIAYLTFTSQWFFSLIGVTFSEQERISDLVTYFAPVLISGILVGIAFVIMKVKGN